MWTVTRQIQWPDGIKMVEVSAGDFNYTNPGQLTERWPSLGEGKEFTDPREAVEAAIQIAKVWSAADEEKIEIGHGATMGMTMPFSSSSEEEMHKWAEKEYEALPKCAQCGEVLGKNSFYHEFSMKDERYCSEHCCEKNYQNYNLHGGDDGSEEEDIEIITD